MSDRFIINVPKHSRMITLDSCAEKEISRYCVDGGSWL